MTIKSGSKAKAEDIKKNIITFLEGINQNTILSANAGITDKSHTYACSDTFSDSNGYNNTIDTANSDVYMSEWTGTGIDFTTEGSSTSDSNVSFKGLYVPSSTGATSYSTDSAEDTQTMTADTYKVIKYWSFTETQITKIECEFHSNTSTLTYGHNLICFARFNSKWYKIGTFTNSSPASYKLYSITCSIKADAISIVGYPTTASYLTWYVRNATAYNGTISNTTIQTNSKTFSSNVKSILVNANKVLNGNSTITIDVSSDGGTNWDITDQPLDTILELDGDNKDIVVKFNLNVDSGNGPELYGYSYQIWT